MKTLLTIIIFYLAITIVRAKDSADSTIMNEEKKWGLQLSMNCNYRFPYQPYIYSLPVVFTVKPSCEILVSRKIFKIADFTSGFIWLSYASVAKWQTTDGEKHKSSMTNNSIGIPIVFSLNMMPTKKVAPTIRAGFVTTTLLSSRTIGGNGLYTNSAEYYSGSTAIFFIGSLQLNIKLKNNVGTFISLDYLQQNKSYIKTSVDTVFDFAKIIRVGSGLKISF